MLTKAQKTILDTLIRMHKDKIAFDHVEFLNRCKIFDLNELLLACESLEQLGYLNHFETSVAKTLHNVSLTHTGLHYREIHRKKLLAVWIPYVITTLIAITALIISILELH